MAQTALYPGTTPTRRRALFGLLDANGWAWASLKAVIWFLLMIFLLGYVPAPVSRVGCTRSSATLVHRSRSSRQRRSSGLRFSRSYTLRLVVYTSLTEGKRSGRCCWISRADDSVSGGVAHTELPAEPLAVAGVPLQLLHAKDFIRCAKRR